MSTAIAYTPKKELREGFNVADTEVVVVILPGNEVTPDHNEHNGGDKIVE